jgi:replication factor C subunit 1
MLLLLETTTATLVAQESGRDVLEFNASDVRSKKAMQEELGDITGSNTLQFGPSQQRPKQKHASQIKKRCIIMDEVDGMGAGDRSGMAELIAMIKSSRVPIICICNDRQNQKIKSLVPYCMDLRYRRPVKTAIANRAIEIAKQEGLIVERNAAESIAESCGNDVRQVLNCLQMWASSSSSNDPSHDATTTTMTYKDLKERERSISKDEILRVSLFDAARVIVEGRKGLSSSATGVGGSSDAITQRDHFFRRNDAYFVDYSFVGLLVHQNYLKIMQPQFNDVKRSDDGDKMVDFLERMHDATQSMSDFGMVENSLRGDQNWSLLPVTAMLAVKTGYHAGGESGGLLPGFPEFTTWLGRNSTRGKKIRLLSEIAHHMNYHISGGPTEMRLSYLPVLRSRLLTLLQSSSGDGGVEEAIALMDEYGLDRDDVFENLDEFSMDDSPQAPNFQKLDSKAKAAFTRTYNQRAHKSQALVAEQGAIKSKTKRQASSISDTKDPDAIDDDHVGDDGEQGNEDENDDEDDELDAEKIKALFQKKKSRGGSKKPAPTKKKSNKK